MAQTNRPVCRYCADPIIIATTPEGKRLPALNATPAPDGPVAAWRPATGQRLGRFLARDEQPTPPAKRYNVHECEGTRRANQRKAWSQAAADRNRGARNRRGKRTTNPLNQQQLSFQIPPKKDE